MKVADGAAHLRGVRDVRRGHAVDAHADRGVELWKRARKLAEGEERQDLQFLKCILALHVEGRVGLGISLLLRQGDGLLIREAALRHLVEHKVARPVEDAPDAANVAGKALLQGPDDRDAPCDGGLEPQETLVREVRPLGEQGLIRRDDPASFLKRPLDDGPGHGDASNDLDDDVRVARKDVLDGGRELIVLSKGMLLPRTLDVSHQNALDPDREPLLLYDADDVGADGAASA